MCIIHGIDYILRLSAENEYHHIQDCFLPKGSYAYPSSVIIFMKWNLYRKVPFCLNKQNVWTYKLRKVYCFKRLWLERNDWIWLHLFINADAGPSWHIFRRTSKQVTSRDVKQSTVTWIATWLRVWAVLFSLPGSVMGRETVYLCYDFSEVLLSWWNRNSNEYRKRLPFNRRARA